MEETVCLSQLVGKIMCPSHLGCPRISPDSTGQRMPTPAWQRRHPRGQHGRHAHHRAVEDRQHNTSNPCSFFATKDGAQKLVEQFEGTSIDDGAGGGRAAWVALVNKYNGISNAGHVASYQIRSTAQLQAAARTGSRLLSVRDGWSAGPTP